MPQSVSLLQLIRASFTSIRARTRSRSGVKRRRLIQLESLEARVLLTSDFGDTPEPAPIAEHSVNNSQHNLFLGNSVDADPDGALQNSTASGDDISGASPDDEDGILMPADLQAAAGTSPVITLLVTNNTGRSATLSGWIDYNQDLVFDNTSERAQAVVLSGTTDARVTLTFPGIPITAVGRTFARFRLSTDPAADHPNGTASDGEVEDYEFRMTNPNNGYVVRSERIQHLLNGGPPLTDWTLFGSSVASLGDLNGDGTPDLAVGGRNDSANGDGRGSVHVMLMNADGTAKSVTRIAHQTNGGPTLADREAFGSAVAAIGDLNGDGLPELAVGACYDNTGVFRNGAVYILFLNADGTVQRYTKIADRMNGGPTLPEDAHFGSAICSLGDLNGDGVPDMVVGADNDRVGVTFSRAGAVYILLMNSDGTVAGIRKITSGLNGGPQLAGGNYFGRSVASPGDLNRDGVADLVVGAIDYDTGGGNNKPRGAVHVLFLDAQGSVTSTRKITHLLSGGPSLLSADHFGISAAAAGDLNGDGVPDLAIGARMDGTGGPGRGAVHLLLMNSDGTVQSFRKIAHQTDGGPPLTDNAQFGSSVTSLGDLNGDGCTELAVGSDVDDAGGVVRGSVHILFLTPGPSLDAIAAISLPEKSSETSLALTGISAGLLANSLRVSAASSNTDLIPTPVVDYESPASTAMLRFTPNPQFTGSTTVTVTVENAGPDGKLETEADNQKAHRSFTITVTPVPPTILSPVLNTTSQRPRLQWTAVADALFYEIWIANASTGQNPYYRSNSISTSFDVPVDLGIGKMDLYVRGMKSLEVPLPWSRLYRFNIVTAPALSLLSNRQETARPKFTWPAVSGAESYNVWMTAQTTGVSQLVRTRVTAPEWTPSADLPMARYFLWVQAVGAGSFTGNWSLRNDFYISPPPQLIAPVLSTFNRTPLFDFGDIHGATSYGVYLRSLVDGSTTANVVGLPTSDWTPSAALPTGRYAWWAIADSSVAGFRSAWSLRQEFHVGGQATLTGPISPVASPMPRIKWQEVTGTARYILQVNGNVEGAKLIYRTDLTKNYFNVEQPLVSGRVYRAWVQAVSTNGELGPWSSVWVFNVATLTDEALLPLLNSVLEQAESGLSQRRTPADVVRKNEPRPEVEWSEESAATVTLWERHLDHLFELTTVADGEYLDS